MADLNQVNIINTALGLLGNEPVADLSDASLNTSNAAVKLMRSIETSRATVLRRHGWVCALTYTTLYPMANAPANFRYSGAFACPGDFLRVWELPDPFATTANAGVVPPGDYFGWADPNFYPQERWQLGTAETDLGAQSIIWTADALTAMPLCYVRKAGWGAIDPHVADAIAFDVAARQCYSINGDLAMAKSLMQQAEAKAIAAVSVDATQEGGQPPYAPSIPAALRNRAR
jgi:hypothetical protein